MIEVPWADHVSRHYTFLILSNENVDFLGRELRWRSYTIKKAFLTTKRIKLVDKKEFLAAALDLEHKIYVVHVGLVSVIMLPSFSLLDIHPFHRPEIARLIAKEAFTKVSNKYVDFADIFSLDLAFKLFEHTKINDYAIKLVDG